MNSAILEPKNLKKDVRYNEPLLRKLSTIHAFFTENKMMRVLENRTGVTRNTTLMALRGERWHQKTIVAAMRLYKEQMEQEEINELAYQMDFFLKKKAERLAAQQVAADNEYFTNHPTEYNKEVQIMERVL